jgi:endonuclease YncB( thermonuclease family)
MRTIFLSIFVIFPLLLSAQLLKGKAVKITDGDTFTLLVDGHEQVRIRIDGIDAPEKGQAFGNRAKEYLSGMIWGEELTVRVMKTDKYGRSIGKVSTPSVVDVGLEMIKAGYAWQYRDYNKEKPYEDAEILARRNRNGLWQDKNPIRPQDFRKTRKNRK